MAGRSPDPRFQPYLPHVGRQLAPGVVVPDVELHVYVHDAGSPAAAVTAAGTTPPACPPSAYRGARGRPRASHCGRPELPHGQGSRQLGAAGPRGTGAAEIRGRSASAAPSFFLVSARRKWLWACVTSARWREAEGPGHRLASCPAPRV